MYFFVVLAQRTIIALNLSIPRNYRWLDPWLPLTNERKVLGFGQALSEFTGETVASKLSEELQRETCPKHPLHGCLTEAVAYCRADPNEVLYLTDHEQHPIACVHLTWQRESQATFPHFDGYANLALWTAQKKREHDGLDPSSPGVV